MAEYRRWLREVTRIARSAGWEVITNKHTKVRGPSGQIVVMSNTPRDAKAILRAAKRDLQRAGFPF